jgi:WD40 repeat protein
MDWTIKIWDARGWKFRRQIRDSFGGIEGVAFAPDSRHLAWGSTDSSVKVADATTGEILETLRGHTSRVMSVAFSPDGKRLASASLDGTIKVWSIPPVIGVAHLGRPQPR